MNEKLDAQDQKEMTLRNLAPPVLVMLVVLAAGTVAHGLMTDRFGMVRTQELEAFTARLDHVPSTIGMWEGTEAAIDPEQIRRANVTGHVSLTFKHRETAETVNMFLVCGTSRHITLHTPDLCYRAAGFDSEGEPTSASIDAGLPQPAEFVTGRFYKEEGGALQRLEVMWSFSSDGQWHGPRWARSSLAGRNAIYKVYLIGPMPSPQQSQKEDSPTITFAREAMPTIQTVLFPDDQNRL